MTKLRTLALVALPLAAAGWLWLGHSGPAASAPPAVARSSVLVAPGRVEPVHDPVALAFEAQGRIRRATRELGRKTVRDDDPRARVDTRVLEVVARFDGPPGAALPLGLRMLLHVDRP